MLSYVPLKLLIYIQKHNLILSYCKDSFIHMLKETLAHSKLAGSTSFETDLTRRNCHLQLGFGNFVELPTQDTNFIAPDVAVYILSPVCLCNCICEAVFSSPTVWPTPEYKLVFSSSSLLQNFIKKPNFLASPPPSKLTLKLTFY